MKYYFAKNAIAPFALRFDTLEDCIAHVGGKDFIYNGSVFKEEVTEVAVVKQNIITEITDV